MLPPRYDILIEDSFPRDCIYFINHSYPLSIQPLKSYLDKWINSPPLDSLDPACLNDYHAIWEITDNKLFLIDFDSVTASNSEINIADLFPNEGNKIFANWFTGQLELPTVDMIINCGKVISISTSIKETSLNNNLIVENKGKVKRVQTVVLFGHDPDSNK